MRVTRLGRHTVNILARSHRIITRTMSHSLPSKGTVLRLFNIVVQWKFRGQLFTCTFSARRPQGISELFFIARIFRSRFGDERRQSTTSGDSRRRSATVGMYTRGRGPKKVHLSASIVMILTATCTWPLPPSCLCYYITSCTRMSNKNHSIFDLCSLRYHEYCLHGLTTMHVAS